MLGKGFEVRSWQGGEGCVFVEDELWNATGGDHPKPGYQAFVEKVDRRVLNIPLSKVIQGSMHDARDANSYDVF
jgi:hypothetical protein